MNDFITLDDAKAFISNPDLKKLQDLETAIAKGHYFEYFGMHLSEGVVYLTYYYRISGRGVHYKFDITVAGSDFHIVLKRVTNHTMNALDRATCSTILYFFPKAHASSVVGCNLIDLGIYTPKETEDIMKKILVP